jgi:hypothetical protein
MLAFAWLAVAGLPVFFQPLPQAHDQTAVAAIAHGLGWRRPCLRLRCPGDEWRRPPAAATFAYRERGAPTSEPLPPLPGAPLAGTRTLHAPYSAQSWSANDFNDFGFGATLGFNPFRTPDTSVRFAFGPALRLQPYVDDGTARRGPVARGRIGVSHDIGDHARITQQTSIETGITNTFVRNSLRVDVFLHPQWVLDSDIETTHDSVPGGSSATDTRGSVNLRYSF